MRFLWFTFVLLSLTTVHTLGQEQKQWSIHAKTGFFTDRVNYPIQIEMGGNLYFKKGFSIGTGLVACHIGDESSEYPIKYDDCTEIAKKELRENSRPKLKQDIDIKEYDTIFVGYPNWWGTMPMPVWSFLEGKDFTDKKILPFCTHEGSGLGKSESDIKKLTSGAEVLKGLAINGSEVNSSEEKIKKWLEEVLE